MSCHASAESAPLAVIRTLMPSMPLARNASVGLPASSNSSMRPASISARPDSLWPHVRSTRLSMVALTPARRCRSPSTVPFIISRISYGTPGTTYTTRSSTSAPAGGSAPGAMAPTPCTQRMGATRPGAVPGCCGIGDAPTGTMAWRKLFSGIGRLRLANMERIRSAMRSSSTNSTPITDASTSRVMSSCVGPRPPHTMTASLRSSASRNASSMRSQLSPTLVW